MIVDASVAIKWLVDEVDSDIAKRLLNRTDLVAPELLFCEVANTVWKKWKRGEFAAVPPGLLQMPSLFEHVVPVSDHAFRAAEIALSIDHPAYDCVYLAIAEARDDIVVSADQRFANKLAGTDFAHLILPLREAASL
jgi:predicted nucleic acid-binding protein